MAMFCTMMNLLHQQFPLDQATRTLTEPVVDRLVEDRLVDDRLVDQMINYVNYRLVDGYCRSADLFFVKQLSFMLIYLLF